MKNNIFGELTLMKQLNIKPNYSDLSRRYGLDRHTIKKYYKEGGKIVKERQSKHSKYDFYKDEIVNLLNKPGVTIKATLEFLKDKYPSFSWNYNGLEDFIKANQLRMIKNEEAHVRFETKPGEKLQVDWKESLKLHDKGGISICSISSPARLSITVNFLLPGLPASNFSKFVFFFLPAPTLLPPYNVEFQKHNVSCIYWCVSKNNERTLRFYDKNMFQKLDISSLKHISGYYKEEINLFVWYGVTKQNH